jgi:hypothetical protein
MMSILCKIKLKMHHGNAVRTNRLNVYNQCLDLLIVFCYTFLYLVIDTCRENRKQNSWSIGTNVTEDTLENDQSDAYFCSFQKI